MSRGQELNRLADRAIARHGLKGAAERVAHGIVEMYEHATGRTMAPAEVDWAYVLATRWLVERGSMAVHVGQETSRLAQLLRSHPGTPSAREIHALSSLAGTS